MRGRGVFAAPLAALLVATLASVARAGTDIGPAGMSLRHWRMIRADCRTSSTRTMKRS